MRRGAWRIREKRSCSFSADREACLPCSRQYWGKQVREATGSILELPFLFGLMKEFPIDGIVHAAFDSAGIDARGGGMSPSSGRTLYDVVQIGINGTINMLEPSAVSSPCGGSSS